MSTTESLFESIERQPLKAFAEKAYLNYSMYVILDRALPHIGDGLKPVQRRIVYAMSQLGLSSGAKFKKSARTVGDVLGKFHPHGDSACYEAMVLLAQPFSFRYPLIEGQGNWGAVDDPKSFAAMRYTEARLAPFSEILLAELDQGTVDWTANFDGTLEEPAVLPARLPHVLLNGASGIAVGMATDIPPHNAREVANAVVHMLQNPKATNEELFKYIKGPDYPSRAEIISSRKDIHEAYTTGHGSIKLRARFEFDGNDIVITALPYQVSGSRVLEQIGAQITDKKLTLIEDLRDESDHEHPTRLVIVPRSRKVDTDALMSHLFATTDLERSYRVNLNVIGLDGRPQVKDLRSILAEWLKFRFDVVRKRLECRLEKVNDRLHVLDGLLIAFLNLDRIIKIIRESDHPREKLVSAFKLTERQADAILDLRLRQLAKLEELKIRTEQSELQEEKEYLRKTLASKRRMTTLIKNEIIEDAEKYGDERNSQLVSKAAARSLDAAELVTSEPATVVLSQMGWVRAAKGHDMDARKLNYRAGDEFLQEARCRTTDNAVFFDSTGRTYTVAVHTLASARGLGEPVTGRVNTPDGATFAGVMAGESNARVLLSTDNGYGFIARLEELLTRNRSGKRIISVSKGARVLKPVSIAGDAPHWVLAISRMGYALVVQMKNLPEMARGKGVKIINVPAPRYRSGEEALKHLVVVNKASRVTIQCGKKHKTMRWRELEEYIGERGRRGRKLPRGYQKVNEVLVD